MKSIKSLLIIALLGSSFTSCNDFLNLEPLNDIVLENFWTDKSDVESVLLGAYSAMEKSDCLLRMSVWGEMRSDNVVEGNGTSDDIRQICRENLLHTNAYCNYKAFYDVVNRANTVLYFAPQVAAKDPNYIIDELLANQAEAIALRCLSYWYLIRSFHDVPYVTEPSIDDEGGHMKFYVPQSSFETILDSLISDLEGIKKYAVNKFSSDEATTCRITKSTICAMLADMYLWRGAPGDWDKCIAVCEEVNALKLADYEKIRSKEGKNCTLKLFNGYPLICDAPEDIPGNSYNEIFGTGNSFESLFEFPYNNDVKNPFVGDYYQNNQSTNVGRIKAFEKIGSEFSSVKGNSVFEQAQDVRYYQNVYDRGSQSYAITKYAYDDLTLSFSSGSLEYSGASFRNQVQANWIIYRYTEVLLFEAEAYIMKAKQIAPAGEDSLTQVAALKEYKDKAFNLIDAVNARSINSDNFNITPNTLTQVISYSNSTTVNELESVLFKERRRELMFEGKRWYDLVRMARRDGNQERLLSFVEKKYDSATLSAVKIKLKNPYAMYFPMAKDEVRNSQGVLKQNPAYKDDEKIEQAH
jgi:hypothetical protein